MWYGSFIAINPSASESRITMIQVTIEIDHGDGSIEIKRDDTFSTGVVSADTRLARVVAAAEAEALAALAAKPQRKIA